MEQIKGYLENGTLNIAFSGHIDSGNAGQVEAEVTALRRANPGADVVIDAEDLEYISSAGLRIILRLRKEVPELKIVNASSSVYEVLEMTGFTEMLTVEKAYRRLTVDGCEVIGKGANGIVYRLDADTIIKTYYNADALEDIHREREIARKAFILGVPTAIPYDVVKVGDSYGSVFELLNARSVSKLIAEDPENIDKYVELYVDLMKIIHDTPVKPGELPEMKAVALDWADFLKDYLPEEQWSKLRGMVEAIPDHNYMIHGDYHTNNVMVQNGEPLLIDMDTICLGHPVFELASMYLGFVAFSELDNSATMRFLGLPRELTVAIWEKSLKLYIGDDDAAVQAAAEKAMIIGYARLMRRTIRRDGLNNEEGQAIIAMCKAHLEELLAKVDSLSF